MGESQISTVTQLMSHGTGDPKLGNSIVHQAPPANETKVTLEEKRKLATSMARAAGADLAELGAENPAQRLVVLAWGAGLFMATCDHLIRAYPRLRILGCDLPLSLGVERRCCVVDWLGSVYRIYLVIWAAGIPSLEYVRCLEQRNFSVQSQGWIYLQPQVPREESMARCRLGFVKVWDPWAPKPLDDLG
jgi:hypothetical protein